MRKINILILSYVHKGGEWIAITRLANALNKNQGRKIQFSNISFVENYREKYTIFKKQILIPRSKARRPLSFIKKLFLDFSKSRKAIIKFLEDGEDVVILATDFLLFLASRSINSASIKHRLFFFQGLRSKLIENIFQLDYRQIILKSIERLALISSDIIIVPSSFARKYALRMLGPLGFLKKFQLIPIGINSVFFQFSKKDKNKFRKKLGMKASNKVILYSGRIAKNKGIENLINAFRKYCESEYQSILLIVYPTASADLDVVKNISLLLKDPNLKNRVKFIKDSTLEELAKIYVLSDISVLASKIEMAPLSLIESLASGTPVIGTRVGNIEELVSKIDHNLLLKDNSSSEILKGINYFFSLSMIKRKELENRSKKLAERFKIENSANILYEFLEKVKYSNARIN